MNGLSCNFLDLSPFSLACIESITIIKKDDRVLLKITKVEILTFVYGQEVKKNVNQGL